VSGTLLPAACGLFGQTPDRVPLHGFVWDPPASAVEAINDLQAMAAAGAEAIRSPFVEEDRVLTIADTLGLVLFQEVVADHMSAQRTLDSRDELAEELTRAAQRAHRHPSLRHIGIGQNLDTSDPRTCAAIRDMADVVRQYGPSGVQVYYLTAFIEDDRCASEVDLVLLDGRGHSTPSRLIARWAATPATPVGLGAIGIGIQPGTLAGTRNPGSPEARARHLENALRDAMGMPAGLAQVVFVDRWRDKPSSEEAFSPAWLSGGADYGLHSPADTASLGLMVARGFFTGSQDAFAFDAGAESTPGDPLLVLAGWAIVLFVGLLFYLSGWFRITFRRYVTARRFYCDFVKRGRDIQTGANIGVGLLLSVCAGICAAVILVKAGELRPMALLLHTVSEALGNDISVSTAVVWQVMAAVTALYFFTMIAWSLAFVIASPGKRRLQFKQTFMIVVWARWLLLPMMLLAITIRGLPMENATSQVVILFLTWLLVSVLYAVRMCLDYERLCPGRSVRVLMAIGAAVAVTVATLWFTGVLEQIVPGIRFFWHLAVRS
jgi:hypothetical protein